MPPRHGTRYEEVGGRLAAIVDRTGHVWATLAWDAAGRLAHLAVPGAIVLGAIERDALLGPSHAVIGAAADAPGTAPAGARAAERPRLTAVSAIDWARPTEIPAIAAPGQLPAGAGGALLNAIAVLARRGGVTALRYAGPYPTAALWRALARSFTPSAQATEAAFSADLIGRIARVARDPIPIDFAPAPCEHVAVAGGHVELRAGLERAVVGGVAYAWEASPARLVRCADRARAPGAALAAEVWIGDAPYARVATFTESGELVDGPIAIPSCASPTVGAAFPAALVAALGPLVAQVVPEPLAAAVPAWLAARPIRWADLGARPAAAAAGELHVHAALWERVAPLGLPRLALALAEALAPVVTAELARAAHDALRSALRGGPPRA
jgi:hypothetical protein